METIFTNECFTQQRYDATNYYADISRNIY